MDLELSDNLQFCGRQNVALWRDGKRTTRGAHGGGAPLSRDHWDV